MSCDNEEMVMSEGVEDPWLEDWTTTKSPEEGLENPVDPYEIVAASSISQYDDIGESATADTIRDYLRGKTVTRSLFMTVLHNSATSASADKGLATVKSFADYHMNHNGWKAIGYHFVIDTKGTIWAGRKMSVTGAHAGSSGNPGSIGVCLVGNFETTDKPTAAQKKSLAALHVSLYDLFYGSVNKRIRFHREFMDTACPGKITQDEVMGWVDEYEKPEPPAGTISIYLDGKSIGTATPINNTSYTAIRPTFEAAGFKVGWIQQKFIVNLTSPGGTPVDPGVSAGTASKPRIVIDGKLVASGVLIEGSTFGPVRAMFEAAGYKVEWKNNNIYVSK